MTILFRPMMLDNNFKDYDEYWERRGFNAPSLERAKKLTKLIDNGTTLLDVGCGDGTVIEYLSKHNKLKDVQGIDISKTAVEHVIKKRFNAEIVDVTSDEFKKFLKAKKFDYVVITEVLEHIQDLETVVSLLHNHIERALFISIPNTGFFIHRFRLMFGRFPLVVIKQHVKEHIRFWTNKDFIYWAHHQGYKVDKVVVTSGMGIKLLVPLERMMPSLFGNQILYKLTKI